VHISASFSAATSPMPEVPPVTTTVFPFMKTLPRRPHPSTRGVDWINNFWKAIANHPATLKRMWDNIKQVMAPGALDPLTKELVYIAVSITNNCPYCIASHTASARGKGMTDEQFAELLAVIGLANDTNRVAIGYGVPIDDRFQTR
jgi:AhpD family alkylhydroperoxidase